MSGGKIFGIAAGLGLGALSLFAWPESESTAAAAPSADDGPREAAQCRLRAEETASFVFESSARLEAPGAEPAVDRLQGRLSWIVVEEARDGEPALLRASLESVVLEQALSRERVSAAELMDGPFYVRADGSCRFTGLGFSPRWSAASRRLVTTLLASYEVVLPEDGATRWQAEQRDGVGAYTALYRARSGSGATRVIVRSKPRYRLDEEARRMGLDVQLLGARAEARFDPARPSWLEHVEGTERVRFHLPGEAPQGFVHRFRLAREEGRRVAIADSLSLSDADFADALSSDHDGPPRASDPALRALDLDAAKARFLEHFRAGGRGGVYPAARFLAEWLRVHPEGSALLHAELRDGAIDEAAHSALFLALELAGTDESREVLAAALTDEHLSELDRARAASALADHGEPSRGAAELLLTQARESGSAMVRSVSLLGAGSMARRTPEGPLREELRAALHGELERASSEGAEVLAVDALGNSGDDAFGPALDERLRDDRPALRAHAAEALGHLSPEVARPLLLARLEREASPAVSTAILRSLGGMESSGIDLPPAELALAARKLATSPSADERAAVIAWLGRAQHQREARGVLADHFAREPSVHLQQRIGAFVSTAELRERAR